jgi:hypothetical protein
VVPTIEENPEPDVLYWVGCAASYDPQSQKTARAFVQLLTRARVNFAVLGKKECCTGDTARRAGNEYLYRQLADQNVTTLTEVRPKLIVATCPHCMNTIGKEYRQIGGDFKVVHHTEYLESLVAEGRLEVEATESSVTYHDPCYLGRHGGVYDAPRNVLRVLTSDFVEMDRKRENSFCCGAGGAQFWKEEEAGAERISDNRYREAEGRLAERGENKVLAVGCPFCKSMLESTPGKGDGAAIAVKDVAELMLESVLRRAGETVERAAVASGERAAVMEAPVLVAAEAVVAAAEVGSAAVPEVSEVVPAVVRKKWVPKANAAVGSGVSAEGLTEPVVEGAAEVAGLSAEAAVPVVVRKKWAPRNVGTATTLAQGAPEALAVPEAVEGAKAEASTLDTEESDPVAPARKKWEPKKSGKPPDLGE